MGTKDDERITLRPEVRGRSRQGAVMLVAAACALAGVGLGYGLGRIAPLGCPAPPRTSVVRHAGPVYAPPCARAEPQLIFVNRGGEPAVPGGGELPAEAEVSEAAELPVQAE